MLKVIACVIAEIDNTSAMGAKLINNSKAGLLKNFKKLDEILAIIDEQLN